MKMRTARTAIAAMSLIGMTGSATAGEWKFLPILDKDYKPEMTLSLIGGLLDPKEADRDTFAGLELAMNCGLFQTPSGVVRTKISFARFDHDGYDYRTFEVNPRWTVPIAQNLSFGIGPGIGYVKTKVGSRDTEMFAWQIGADLDYRIGQINLGLGARWQDTVNKTVAIGTEGAENWLVQAKIGFAF